VDKRASKVSQGRGVSEGKVLLEGEGIVYKSLLYDPKNRLTISGEMEGGPEASIIDTRMTNRVSGCSTDRTTTGERNIDSEETKVVSVGRWA